MYSVEFSFNNTREFCLFCVSWNKKLCRTAGAKLELLRHFFIVLWRAWLFHHTTSAAAPYKFTTMNCNTFKIHCFVSLLTVHFGAFYCIAVHWSEFMGQWGWLIIFLVISIKHNCKKKWTKKILHSFEIFFSFRTKKIVKCKPDLRPGRTWYIID